MKTYNAKPGEITREWYLVDAEGQILGRLATQLADRLRGKGKPQYTPHVDTGDFVVVVNAEKIAVTGNKLDDKMYYRHSGYPGGLKQRPAARAARAAAEEVIRKAVKGMLPRNASRPAADHEAQDLRRPGASARGAGSEAAGGDALMATRADAPTAQYLGTGKRKTSVARVILRPGDGKTWVNGKTIEEYFPRLLHRTIAVAPLKTAGLDTQYDLRVRVHGGGPSGQAGAVGTASLARSSRSIPTSASRSSGRAS